MKTPQNAVAAAVASSFTVKWDDENGKPQSLTQTLSPEVDAVLSAIMEHSTAADDLTEDNFEQIVIACFPANQREPINGEPVSELRDRLFKAGGYQFLFGVMQQKHRKWVMYADQTALFAKEGKSTAGEVAKSAANGLLASIKSTATYQARAIIRKYANKFGVAVDGGDRKQESARSVIEGMIGVLDGIATKPRGDQKLEGELVMYRGAREALRDFLASSRKPVSIFDVPAAPATHGAKDKAAGPVVNLTKAQIAELTK